MNYRLFLKISLIFTIILTLCICFTKPQMHKTFMVYDSKYTVVEPKVEVEKVKELPTVKQETEKK